MPAQSFRKTEMANALVTSQIITNEVLRIAHNASAFLGNMNTDYKESWNGEYKPGSTVKARGPVQFTHRTARPPTCRTSPSARWT
jgi:hypothetical protein